MAVLVPAILEDSLPAVLKRMKQVASPKYHLDFMDGSFSLKKSVLPAKLARLKRKAGVTAHLMVDKPEKYLKDVSKFADSVVAHIEVLRSVRVFAEEARRFKLKVGLAIDPGTLLVCIFPVLDLVDFVVVMTVVPGRQGAPFVPVALRKVRALRKRFPKLTIAVDGGMRLGSVAKARDAGADIISAGSAIFWTHYPKEAFAALSKEAARR